MGTPRKKDPIKYCNHCGDLLVRKRYNRVLEDYSRFLNRKYCDKICFGAASLKEDAQIGSYRKRTKKDRKDACEQCSGKKFLGVHHKDRNPKNNDPANLETLCNSCHMKEHWRAGDIPKSKKTKNFSCKICGEPAKYLDMCEKHYSRFRIYGDPLKTKRRINGVFQIVTMHHEMIGTRINQIKGINL